LGNCELHFYMHDQICGDSKGKKTVFVKNKIWQQYRKIKSSKASCKFHLSG